MSIELRPARLDDCPLVASMMDSLFLHCRIEGSDPFVKSYQPTPLPDRADWLAKVAASRNAFLFVAVEAGKEGLQGFIKAEVAKPYLESEAIRRIGHINMLWVEPSARRGSVGRRLVAAVEEAMRQRGIEHIDLHYLVGNDAAAGFWEALGYRNYRISSLKSLR